ncbi:hypothetical protein DLAC_09080 [Tieghemostelium lacteum]|uniref:Uncharacterized protein n=1 Tax=Tieghemostelium lacteum TaxID=361077 RepID=A0A151Z936_TIELA|nr:hypothetical protein DLAC_09080 [Tieghemostelium lacteum]|eukprot:KYQ90457.1 hypothetical protein DLAC_09080 [Tieghemostelium lacteum]
MLKLLLCSLVLILNISIVYSASFAGHYSQVTIANVNGQCIVGYEVEYFADYAGAFVPLSNEVNVFVGTTQYGVSSSNRYATGGKFYFEIPVPLGNTSGIITKSLVNTGGGGVQQVLGPYTFTCNPKPTNVVSVTSPDPDLIITDIPHLTCSFLVVINIQVPVGSPAPLASEFSVDSDKTVSIQTDSQVVGSDTSYTLTSTVITGLGTVDDIVVKWHGDIIAGINQTFSTPILQCMRPAVSYTSSEVDPDVRNITIKPVQCNFTYSFVINVPDGAISPNATDFEFISGVSQVTTNGFELVGNTLFLFKVFTPAGVFNTNNTFRVDLQGQPFIGDQTSETLPQITCNDQTPPEPTSTTTSSSSSSASESEDNSSNSLSITSLFVFIILYISTILI